MQTLIRILIFLKFHSRLRYINVLLFILISQWSSSHLVGQLYLLSVHARCDTRTVSLIVVVLSGTCRPWPPLCGGTLDWRTDSARCVRNGRPTSATARRRCWSSPGVACSTWRSCCLFSPIKVKTAFTLTSTCPEPVSNKKYIHRL